MADSLDDFFAKKDSKRRPKKKNLTTEEMAKKLEETGKRASRKAKDKSGLTQGGNTSDPENEEWNDFEEDKEKDYSGLRIQTLTIKDKEEEFREQQLQDIEEEKQKDVVSGPWRGVVPSGDGDSDADKASEEKKTEAVAPVVTPVAPPPATSGKYIPPQLRNQSQQPSSSPSMTPTPLFSGVRRSKSGAPRIGDTVEFPSLGAVDSNEDNKGFQTVRSGNSRDLIDKSSANVTLDNKYGLLTNTSKELQNND